MKVCLNLLLDNMLKLIVYLTCTMKINQLDLRSDLCDYSDAYVLVSGTITVTANAGANNKRDKKKIGQ